MEKNTKPFISQIKSSILWFPHKSQIAIAAFGLGLVVTGLLVGNKLNLGGGNIEVLQTPSSNTNTSEKIEDKIIVDVSGAVENPGVYHLPSTSRIEDALVVSGGLSSNADRNWIDKNLNRAAKLIDGQKVYIPSIQQSNILGASNSSTQSYVAQSNYTSDSNLLNINSASIEDIETLPGIGQVHGQNIIDQRPYSDINDLVSKKVISQSIFNKIKDKITVY